MANSNRLFVVVDGQCCTTFECFESQPFLEMADSADCRHCALGKLIIANSIETNSIRVKREEERGTTIVRLFIDGYVCLTAIHQIEIYLDDTDTNILAHFAGQWCTFD